MNGRINVSTPRWMIAIAAMAENRVIGHNGGIPWLIPEDFQFFKQTTMGGVLVMGRRTFESIGRPLPGRRTIVISTSGRTFPGVESLSDLSQLRPESATQPVFLCGGEALYRAGLPFCRELLISHVRGAFDGDTFFPPFETEFVAQEIVLERPEFRVVRYQPRA